MQLSDTWLDTDNKPLSEPVLIHSSPVLPCTTFYFLNTYESTPACVPICTQYIPTSATASFTAAVPLHKDLPTRWNSAINTAMFWDGRGPHSSQALHRLMPDHLCLEKLFALKRMKVKMCLPFFFFIPFWFWSFSHSAGAVSGWACSHWSTMYHHTDLQPFHFGCIAQLTHKPSRHKDVLCCTGWDSTADNNLVQK